MHRTSKLSLAVTALSSFLILAGSHASAFGASSKHQVSMARDGRPFSRVVCSGPGIFASAANLPARVPMSLVLCSGDVHGHRMLRPQDRRSTAGVVLSTSDPGPGPSKACAAPAKCLRG